MILIKKCQSCIISLTSIDTSKDGMELVKNNDGSTLLTSRGRRPVEKKKKKTTLAKNQKFKILEITSAHYEMNKTKVNLIPASVMVLRTMTQKMVPTTQAKL